jgi:flagellar basal-body rod protein FlgB
MNDATMDVLHGMLRGLAARQRVINDNIANVETPNFHAQRVEFEAALRDAVKSGRNGDIAPEILPTNDPALPNGNNVSIDKEIVAMQDTGLRYQLAIEAMNAKLMILRTSIKGAI